LALAGRLIAEGWAVSGTCQSADKAAELTEQGIRAIVFNRTQVPPRPERLLDGVTDVLVSVPPDEHGDPVLDHFVDTLRHASLRWLGYLSTTGVYGDCGGRIVDETAPLQPTSDRSRRRVEAENRWLGLHRDCRQPVHVFRLAGIYGPGRSAIDQVRRGEARRIRRPGYVFSRIHVEDIALILRASMARPSTGRIYNVCDDEPAEPSEVTAYGCRLLGVPIPPEIPFAEIAPRMSPMALSFWQDRRRIANNRIKRELGIQLRYPNFRVGLAAIAAQQDAAVAPHDVHPRPPPGS
jgi:nucleoside-diphosphate-sugar epimerase